MSSVMAFAKSLPRKLDAAWKAMQGYDNSDPRYNGEYHFLRKYIKPSMTIFDVGANIGEYSEYILKLNRGAQTIHCFEPVKTTYEQLNKTLAPFIAQHQHIITNNFGLSNESGHKQIYIYGELDGANSLYDRSGDVHNFNILRQEDVVLSTLDDYAEQNGVTRIDFLKLDVEGHELKVLQGASRSLSSGLVRCIHFEYGGTYSDSGATLQAMYNLLSDHNYSVYHLLMLGRLQKISHFSPSLENYRYSNWIALPG